MGRMASIGKIIHGLTNGVSFIGMFLLIPMMLLTAVDVIGRTVYSRPISGAVELSSYMMAIFILLGVAYTHQVKGHVRVTMLVSRIPKRAANLLDILTTLLSLFIIGIVAWQGWVVGMEERTVSDMLRIPQYPFRLLVSLAAALLCLELLIDLAANFQKLMRNE